MNNGMAYYCGQNFIISEDIDAEKNKLSGHYPPIYTRNDHSVNLCIILSVIAVIMTLSKLKENVDTRNIRTARLIHIQRLKENVKKPCA